MKKEIPILMQTPMVKATNDETKTETRRLRGLTEINEPGQDAYAQWIFLGIDINPDLIMGYDKNDEAKIKSHVGTYAAFEWTGKGEVYRTIKCPYGSVGDILWVRETFQEWEYGGYAYKADGFIKRYGAWELDTPKKFHDVERIEKWCSSLHMPKVAARIFLEVTEIKVQRLQEITKEEAIAEGISPDPIGDGLFMNYEKTSYRYVKAVQSYKSLWETINVVGSWSANPYVWVIKFKKLNNYKS